MPETETETIGNTSTDGTHEDASSSFATSPDSSIEEPTTGPLFWEKRRAEWLKDPLEPRIPSPSDENVPGTKARARLEELLAEPLAEEDDMVWNDTVSAIYKGLSRGDKLKKTLPLPLVIKILRGGWLRDGTWPAGMPIPTDDHAMAVPEPPSRIQQWNNPR